jgi:hypothetical protein
MITDMNARVAMAQKLSIPQLQQAIKSGSIPAYVGVPLLQDKMRQQQQMQMAAQQQSMSTERPPIAEEIMAQAGAMGGVDQLPSNLPIQNEEDEENYAGGGIIAFKDEGQVRDPNKDPRIIALREDPAYLAFAENATAEGKDASLTAFLESGNLPSMATPQGFKKQVPVAPYAPKTTYSAAGKNADAFMELGGINTINEYLSHDPDIDSGALAFAGHNFNLRRSLAEHVNAGKDFPYKNGRFYRQVKQAQVNQGGDRRAPADRNSVDIDRPTTTVMYPDNPNTYPVGPLDNEPTYEPVPASPVGRRLADIATDVKGQVQTYGLRQRLYQQYSDAASGLSNATEAEQQAAKEMLKRIRSMSGAELNALAEEGNTPAVAAVGATQPTAQPTPQAAPKATPERLGSEFGIQGIIANQNGRPVAPTAPNTGIANIRGANAPAQGGTAPSGAVSATSPAASPASTPTAPVSALDKYAEMLMEERKGIAKDRQAAKAMALVQAGLGVAGGTSPNPFANLAQGIIPATQAYQAEMKGIRREDADRLKHLMSMGVSKEKLALEARKLGITEKRFDQMYDLETAKLGVMGGQRADARAQAEELRRLSVAQGFFKTFYDKNPMATDAEKASMWSQAQQMAGQAAATPSTSNVMGSYVPGKGYIPNK